MAGDSVTKQIETLEIEEQQIKDRIVRFRTYLNDEEYDESTKEHYELSLKRHETRLKDTQNKLTKLRGENRKSAILAVIITLIALIVLHYLGIINLWMLLPAEKLTNPIAGTEEERRQYIRELMLKQKEEEATYNNEFFM
ncbi:hypothetical protein AKO1_013051 [Acrasis kona]|uniref:Uncharacterized protein n=1 Tax=Acrasis kona TaxID=1008807 RepID=A0AAW2YY29_9EUKA